MRAACYDYNIYHYVKVSNMEKNTHFKHLSILIGKIVDIFLSFKEKSSSLTPRL